MVLYGIDVLDCDTDELEDFQNRMKKGYGELLKTE